MNQRYSIFMVSFGLLVGLLSSCATKKDQILFQGLNESLQEEVSYAPRKIQVNDILDVKISALNPETAIPYNAINLGANNVNNVSLLSLQGYLVTIDGSIGLPILGNISAGGKTMSEVEAAIVSVLEDNGHLVSPKVTVRILNAKVTILGEVTSPGTYTYTEQYITFPQALGYAGDVTIGANRKEVWLIREEEGMRKYHKIDLTQTDWFNSPYYTIKQNDIIYVHPNEVKVKSAGFIGNTGTVLSVISILFTTYALLTR
jgi:polysaccharide biosynthesis/export protein